MFVWLCSSFFFETSFSLSFSPFVERLQGMNSCFLTCVCCYRSLTVVFGCVLKKKLLLFHFFKKKERMNVDNERSVSVLIQRHKAEIDKLRNETKDVVEVVIYCCFKSLLYNHESLLFCLYLFLQLDSSLFLLSLLKLYFTMYVQVPVDDAHDDLYFLRYVLAFKEKVRAENVKFAGLMEMY